MSAPELDLIEETVPGRIAGRLANVVWSLVVVVLVLLALFVGVGRQLTQDIDRYRPDIEARLTEALGYQVHIGGLKVRWKWLDPVVLATDVQLQSPDESLSLGALGSLRIRLDTLMSLMRLRVVFGEFEADRLDLTLVQSDDGRIMLEGLSQPAPVMADGEPAVAATQTNWFRVVGPWLSDPSVRITRVNLKLRTRQDQTRHIDIPQLDLHYERGLFSASGRAMQAGTTRQLASFRLLGLHFFRGDFTGQVYLSLNSGRLFDALVSKYQWSGVGVEGFDVGGEAWLTLRDGILEQVNGQLKVPYLQLRADGQSMAPVEDLAVNFGWRGGILPGRDSLLSGELHLKDIRWRWLGESVSGFSLFLHRRDGYLEARANGVPVGPLSHFALALQLLPATAEGALEGYQPEGVLNDLALTIPLSERGPEFSLTTDFENLQVAAFHGAPELSGANGTLEMERNRGSVRVVGEKLSLGFPELYQSSWTMDYADVDVGWELDGSITRVTSGDIHLLYDGATELDGAFDLRMDLNGEDNLGLKVGVRNGNASMLSKFVPSKAVAPALYDWLTTAITSASIDEGVYYGHGQIDPGAPRYSFTSSMWYRFSDANIHYDNAWPEVSNARGSVMVHDGRTLVELDSAETGGLSLADARVRVEPGSDGLTLFVDADTTASGSAIGYWLDNSPLGDMAGDAAASVEIDGDYRLDLGLKVPLSDGGQTEVDVTVDTSNGSVGYPAADLAWTNVSGKLKFNSLTGFSYDTVTARFMGQPVNMGIEYHPEKQELSLSQTGQMAVADALDAVGLPEGAQTGLAGTFSYTARLDLTAEATSGLSLYSSLLGVSVDWPAPLEKNVDALVPITANLTWEPDGALLTGRWDDRLGFRVLWGGGAFDRAGISLGASEATLPDVPGITLDGRVERLNVDEWADRIGQVMPATRSGGSRGQTDTGAIIDHWLGGIDLSVGQLEVLGQSFPEVDVSARFDNGRWLIGSHSERATGQLSVPLDLSQTVVVNLDTLRLIGDDSSEGESAPELTAAEQVDAFRAMAMEGWPRVQVAIDTLMLDDRPLGRWSFLMVPQADTLDVQALNGELGSLAFSGDLKWDIRDGRQTSRLTGMLTGQDLGDLAQLVGAQAPLRNEKSQIEMNVTWPGRPDGFELTRLEGEVGIRLDNGVILENNYTAQLFRLFNVLNADNLWRRLKLDFSDLYEAGIAFDAVSGTAVLNDGTLTWSPELQIVGPSGAFKLSGTTNMIDESLDMRLVVVLPLTQNLPLAAILMGASAPIGGALFVLDKVLGDPLSKLTSATYRVQGTWDQPEVNLKNVFDTGS